MFALEGSSLGAGFLDDRLGLDDKPDKEAGQQRHDRHQDTVADEVPCIQDGHAQGLDEIPDPESQGRGDAHEQGIQKDQDAGFAAGPVEKVHQDGDDGFHQGDGGGNGRKKYEYKKDRAQEPAELNAGKYLGKGDEHQPGACFQRGRVSAGKREYGGNDHQKNEKRDPGVEDLDLPYGAFQVGGFFHIGSVGDHDPHGKGHGIKQLSHGGEQSLDRKVGHVRQDVIFYAVNGSVDGQDIEGDAYDQDDQQRHHDLADLLDPLFHAADHDRRGDRGKDQKPDDGLRYAGDEAGKIIVLSRRGYSACQEGKKVLDDPPADDRVIGEDDDRYQCDQDTHKAIALIQRGKGSDGAQPGLPAQCDLCGHQREPEGHRQDDIAEEKGASAVLRRQIGKTPDVPQTDRRPGGGKNKAYPACKVASAAFHIKKSSSYVLVYLYMFFRFVRRIFTIMT